ncbi:MarR family winged helix-turn-helix transcriptional regulator [Dermabacter vaginalis]|uniref:Winged helix-turn-helix transcriptional regulator n=1 Tax=Dermabacter vaginalis TaxID=1630135 RepID=A0ABX6A235_9MICO|nr:MarR family winged helix-turn-helix transcriptional regulator [Dermabacter vaginalis]QEU11222.1 winged helix-turn-helix transcriptional regulator [Dermabacter vaginalis]
MSAKRRTLTPLVEIIDEMLLISRRIQALTVDIPGMRGLSTVEAMILRHIGRTPGITPGKVAEDIILRPSNASAAIRDLEVNGLVGRVPDMVDRRSNHLFITEKGERAVAAMHQAWEEYYSGALAPGDLEEARAVVRAMGERVRASMMGDDPESDAD